MIKKFQTLIAERCFKLAILMKNFRIALERSLLIGNSHKIVLVERFLNNIYEKRASDDLFIERQIGLKNRRVLILENENNLHGRRFFLESLFGTKIYFLNSDFDEININNVDLIVVLGYSSLKDNIHILSEFQNIPILFRPPCKTPEPRMNAGHMG